MPESIMDAVRGLRRRFGRPRRARRGNSLATMTVGTSGYLEDGQISVDADGQPTSGTAMTVEPIIATRPYPVEWVHVERIGESEYAFTARDGAAFGRTSSGQPRRERLFSTEPYRPGDFACGDQVRFAALYAAPNLAHPHHRRRTVTALRATEDVPRT